MAKDTASEDVKSVLTVLAFLAVAAPQAAVVVASVGAVAMLIRTGAKIISAIAESSIGTYPTSVLPHERFGVGRHPLDGVSKAQDRSGGLRGGRDHAAR